jgi:hypothetical protein
MRLPLLDSNPGAPATIYLDFTGNFESDWFYLDRGREVHFQNVETPIFNTDRSPDSFGTDEQAQIREIWSRVAEDFAPFNVNVSTAYYGSFDNGKALHVVIGGSGDDWLHQDVGGYASIGSFSDSAPNVVFVFDEPAWAIDGVTEGDGKPFDTAAWIANTISHEAGHAFKLRHQSLYSASGTKLDDYHPGTAGWAPIMGSGRSTARTTWEAGPTDLGPNTLQFDMDVIASSANGFGFKADDHGSATFTASSLTTRLAVGPLTGKGIVNNSRDVDAFKFATQGGTLQITVDAAQVGPNLIPVAELWSAKGLVARANAGGLTQSIINASVPTGTYYVMVKGFGDYGGVGQYTVSVSLPQVTSEFDSGGGSTTSGGVIQPTTGWTWTLATFRTASSPDLQTYETQATPTSDMGTGSLVTSISGAAATPVVQSQPTPTLLSTTEAARHDAVLTMDDLYLDIGQLEAESLIAPLVAAKGSRR